MKKIGYNGENTIFKEITYEIEKVALRSRCCFEMRPLLLTACGQSEKKADAPKTFSYVYAMDPSSLDYSVTSKSSTSDVIAKRC